MSFSISTYKSVDGDNLYVNTSTGTPHAFLFTGVGFTSTTKACFRDGGNYQGHYIVWDTPVCALQVDGSLKVTATVHASNSVPNQCMEPGLADAGAGPEEPADLLVGLILTLYQNGNAAYATIQANYTFVAKTVEDDAC